MVSRVNVMSEKEQTRLEVKTYWEIEVRDKHGKLLEARQFEARSWLAQMILMLKGQFATRYGTTVGNGNVTVTDETGAGRSYPSASSSQYGTYYMNLSTLGDYGDVTQGIIVGSGNAPNTLNTYALQSKIAHGTGSGQLIYNAETVESVINPSGMDLQFRITRTFTNNSGAVVTVAEIGILVRTLDASISARSFLVVRDVLPSPSSIPDGATMTIRYYVKMTVS